MESQAAGVRPLKPLPDWTELCSVRNSRTPPDSWADGEPKKINETVQWLRLRNKSYGNGWLASTYISKQFCQWNVPCQRMWIPAKLHAFRQRQKMGPWSRNTSFFSVNKNKKNCLSTSNPHILQVFRTQGHKVSMLWQSFVNSDLQKGGHVGH